MTRTAGKPAPRSNEWVSLVEAAREIGETRQTVLTRVIKGELEAQHVAGRTVVSRVSLDRFLKGK